MAVFPDRLLAAFHALVKSAFPRIDYYTTYRARVVSQSSSDPKDPTKGDLLDVVPDDPRLPSMGGIPFRQGIPGTRVQIKDGGYVYVGWSGGDPSQPFCCLQDVDSAAVQITIVADVIELGGKGLDPVMDGIVTGRAIDSFTGLQQWQLGNVSAHVRAKKA